MKRLLLIVTVGGVFCMGAAKVQAPGTFSLPTCLQDQYGNQYDNLAVDIQHHIITGTVINNQGCTGSWSMIGSYVINSNQVIMEITAANSGTDCQPVYTLRGVYPAAYWNYDTGWGNQPFVYTGCSSRDALPVDRGVGGAHGTLN